MNIRPATAADISVMMALEKRAVTAAHWLPEQYELLLARHEESGGVAGDMPARQPAGCRNYEGPLRVALVIEEESVAQGFLVARALGTEWEIENIAISGQARRRGLGTRLLGEFLDYARRQGAEAVFLEVRESNLAARALYEKWAFEESGRRVGYYRDPDEDAIAYRLCFP